MLASERLSHHSVPAWMTELSEHLEPVLAEARRIDGKKDDFYHKYQTWLRINRETISSTTKVRDEIVDNNREHNHVSVGTSTVGITGGIMTFLGVCAALPTGGTSLVVAGAVLGSGSFAISQYSKKGKNKKNQLLCEQAANNLETHKSGTVSFNAECQSYFESLDAFNTFFSSISGNDVALALFYEVINEEEFNFLADFRLDRSSINLVHNALEEIIESDVTKLNPRMWSAQFVSDQSKKMKSLPEKILAMIRELKRIINKYPALSNYLKEKFREFLILKLKNIQVPNAEETIKRLTDPLPYKGDFLRITLVAVHAVNVAVGIADLIKAINNLENCSQSEESKNITEVINNLKEVRKNVKEEMGKLFGW